MNDHYELLIEQYFDGLLSEEGEREVEALLRSNSAFKESVDRQRAIHGALQRMFQPPALLTEPVLPLTQMVASDSSCRPVLVADGNSESDVPAGTGIRRALRNHRVPWFTRTASLGIAAALTLLLCAVSVLVLLSRPLKVVPPAMTLVSADRAYRDAVADGFAPEWVCETDQQFAMMLHWRLDQAMLLKETPESVKILGWRYVPCMSPETMMLLTRVDSQPVVVLIDRNESTKRECNSEARDLVTFKRRVGSLLLVEVTPHPAPHVLEHFYVPDHVPENWYKTAPYP